MFQIVIIKNEGKEDKLILIDPNDKYIGSGNNEEEINNILKDYIGKQVLVKIFRGDELITYFIADLVKSESSSIKIKIHNENKKRR